MTLPDSTQLSADDDVIQFYDKSTPYYYDFTPYSQLSVKIGLHNWPTLNHYYQAEKLNNESLRYEIKGAPTAAMASHMTYFTYRQFTTSLSLIQKRRVMQTGLEAKFNQHPYLKDKLIATGNRKLLFEHPADLFWGTGGSDKDGDNVLGELLMELRSKLTNTNPSELNLNNSNFKLEAFENEIFLSDEGSDNQPRLRQPNQFSADLAKDNSRDFNNNEDIIQGEEFYRTLFILFVLLVSLLVFVFFII